MRFDRQLSRLWRLIDRSPVDQLDLANLRSTLVDMMRLWRESVKCSSCLRHCDQRFYIHRVQKRGTTLFCRVHNFYKFKHIVLILANNIVDVLQNYAVIITNATNVQNSDAKDKYGTWELIQKFSIQTLETSGVASIGPGRPILRSGVTPIGQGWTNARGIRGLGKPEIT